MRVKETPLSGIFYAVICFSKTKKLEQRKTNQNTKLKCDIVMELYTHCTYQLTYSQRSCDIREVIGRSLRLKFWSVPTGEFPLRLRHSGFVIICRTLTGRPTKIIGEMIKSCYFICQICQRLDYFAIFVIFRIIPVNIYFFKVTMETLEKGVKYVQSDVVLVFLLLILNIFHTFF